MTAPRRSKATTMSLLPRIAISCAGKVGQHSLHYGRGAKIEEKNFLLSRALEAQGRAELGCFDQCDRQGDRVKF